jgi:hypothetical protein
MKIQLKPHQSGRHVIAPEFIRCPPPSCSTILIEPNKIFLQGKSCFFAGDVEHDEGMGISSVSFDLTAIPTDVRSGDDPLGVWAKAVAGSDQRESTPEARSPPPASTGGGPGNRDAADAYLGRR